jgi:hypothetical protein
MLARKMRTGDVVKVMDGELIVICSIYSITTNHIVLKMPNRKLWCLTLSNFQERVYS